MTKGYSLLLKVVILSSYLFASACTQKEEPFPFPIKSKFRRDGIHEVQQNEKWYPLAIPRDQHLPIGSLVVYGKSGWVGSAISSAQRLEIFDITREPSKTDEIAVPFVPESLIGASKDSIVVRPRDRSDQFWIATVSTKDVRRYSATAGLRPDSAIFSPDESHMVIYGAGNASKEHVAPTRIPLNEPRLDAFEI